MSIIKEKERKRQRRHWHIRSKLSGTAERPRLVVHRSLKHIYAQLIDDEAGKTLVSSSTRSAAVKSQLDGKSGGNVAAAQAVGKSVAEAAKAAGVTKVRFDRGGYKYHGRIKALADAAREAGLEF